MYKVLFVTEKWCDGKPELGWTNNFHNTFRTFSQYGSGDRYQFDTIHIDEAVSTYGTHVDKILPGYCERENVDIVIFFLMNGCVGNPSIECFQTLRKMGKKLVIIWPDTGPDWGIKSTHEYAPYVDLQVSWDYPRSVGGHWDSVYDLTKRAPNHIDMWTPEDKTLFYYEDKKDIDVSFVGSVNHYRDRLHFCQLLEQQKDLNVFVSGGQRQSKLTPEVYAMVVRTSKIGINFPLSQTGVFYQAKGRIFEYTCCGGLLMDISNPSTDAFFTPGEEYVAFESFDDLFDKIKYYLLHDDERRLIATRGNLKFDRLWTGYKWWNKFFEELETR